MCVRNIRRADVCVIRERFKPLSTWSPGVRNRLAVRPSGRGARRRRVRGRVRSTTVYSFRNHNYRASRGALLALLRALRLHALRYDIIVYLLYLLRECVRALCHCVRVRVCYGIRVRVCACIVSVYKHEYTNIIGASRKDAKGFTVYPVLFTVAFALSLPLPDMYK